MWVCPIVRLAILLLLHVCIIVGLKSILLFVTEMYTDV